MALARSAKSLRLSRARTEPPTWKCITFGHWAKAGRIRPTMRWPPAQIAIEPFTIRRKAKPSGLPSLCGWRASLITPPSWRRKRHGLQLSDQKGDSPYHRRMVDDLSKPLDALPGFLSTISMVEDNQAAIIKGFIGAERKSPPRYDAARQLIFRTLEGQISLIQALDYADGLSDPVDRRCAQQVLRASRSFLEAASVAPVAALPPMSVEVRAGLFLSVGPIWVRQLEEPRLLLLHLWDRPLNNRQVRAALAVLRTALATQQPAWSYREIDFVSVATPELAAKRLCRVYNWRTFAPMEEDELARFLRDMLSAWDAYHRLGPRPVKRRGPPGLFD